MSQLRNRLDLPMHMVSGIDLESPLQAFVGIAAQHDPDGVIRQLRPVNGVEWHERVRAGGAQARLAAIVDRLDLCLRILENREEKTQICFDTGFVQAFCSREALPECPLRPASGRYQRSAFASYRMTSWPSHSRMAPTIVWPPVAAFTAACSRPSET